MWFIEKQTLSIKLLSQTIMSVGKDEEPHLNSQCISIIRCAKLKATAPTPPFWTTLTTEKDTTSSLQPLKITAVHVHQFSWSAGPSCQSASHISALNDLIQTVVFAQDSHRSLSSLRIPEGHVTFNKTRKDANYRPFGSFWPSKLCLKLVSFKHITLGCSLPAKSYDEPFSSPLSQQSAAFGKWRGWWM